MNVDVAVVTGGAAGLGRLVTRRLAGRGLLVVVADTDSETGSRLVEELADQGRRAAFVDTDTSDAEAVRRLMTHVRAEGTLKVLVNNAGGWLPGPQYPDSDHWRQSLELNLLMPMLATQLALPLMSRDGGGIVNVSSSGGWGSDSYGSPEYGAAKAGLIRFTTALGDWAERYGVRVNCVVPHWIGLDRAVREYQQMTARRRELSGGLVDPDLVADTIVDLALDRTSAGRVIMIRPGHDPYAVDPGSADPQQGPSLR